MKMQNAQKNKNLLKTIVWSAAAAFVISGGAAAVHAATPSSVSDTVYSGSINVATAPQATPQVLDASAPPPAAPPALDPLGTPPGGPALAPHLHLGPGLEEIDRDALISVLGISTDELRSALESGKSLSQIAAGLNVDGQKITGLAVQALTIKLDRELQDGRITQTQYESRINEAAARAEAMLTRTAPTPPQPGSEPAAGLPLGPGTEELDKDALPQLLGLSQDSLAEAVHSGQSLADIASAQGVDQQKVADLLAEGMLKHLDRELADQAIWTDEYETRKQEIAARALEEIKHSHPAPPAPPAAPAQQTSSSN